MAAQSKLGAGPATVRLAKPLSRAIRAGHPWVFRQALLSLPRSLPSGAVVDLLDERGDWLARGTLDIHSALAFRVWTLDRGETLNHAWLVERLSAARALRECIVPADVTGYRVCHGENDFVPGVYADRYGQCLSLSTDGGLGRAWEERFVDALSEVWSPQAVVCRNREVQGGAARVVRGAIEGPVVISEGTRSYAVDVLAGQKTGFFADQRPNRDRIQALSAGARVLNLFSYTGGFSVAAALGGASRVVSVDSAAPAMDAARENFERNGISLRDHGFEAVDAFEYLDGQAPHSFDIVVCDPPAFAPNHKSVPKARAAYASLNARAMRVVGPRGWLATASCSSHVSPEMFVEIVGDAARQAGRRARVVELTGAGADHPVRVGFPEGRYLTFALVWMDG